MADAIGFKPTSVNLQGLTGISSWRAVTEKRTALAWAVSPSFNQRGVKCRDDAAVLVGQSD